ncbi:hypothetical protein MTY59_47070 [Mycobacterium senriense]|uniref:Uncharacterized protein n=1 Tax=Mycobacterium senriense TaxID=2775496 RepID=A0ABM7SWG5_9MYCO|nr:hypothetical protein MTY59_47070 [Mycobacterium senriense]
MIVVLMCWLLLSDSANCGFVDGWLGAAASHGLGCVALLLGGAGARIAAMLLDVALPRGAERGET